jgi:hypothetical protein
MFKIVNDVVKNHRMSICKNCEFLREISNTCKQCGCFMPAKTAFAQASCPVNKWTAIQNQPVAAATFVNKLEEQIVESWNKQ